MNTKLPPLALILVAFAAGSAAAQDPPFGGAGDPALKQAPIGLRADPALVKLVPALGQLAQRITVSPKDILVEGENYQATAMASVTLLQALQTSGGQLRLPPMLIKDKPGSQYCGTMLDVARQWHPIEYLHEVVDLCRLYKVRFLHFHFTDDQGYRLPSKAYPQIPTPGASYGWQEMRDFVAYADSRGVTVIPEIELPGHSSALQGAMPETFGAKNPATGKLARFESTGKLARNLGGPLILAASGQLEALTAGEYRIVCRGKNVRLTEDHLRKTDK